MRGTAFGMETMSFGSGGSLIVGAGSRGGAVAQAARSAARVTVQTRLQRLVLVATAELKSRAHRADRPGRSAFPTDFAVGVTAGVASGADGVSCSAMARASSSTAIA